jgi:hypothetical protein
MARSVGSIPSRWARFAGRSPQERAQLDELIRKSKSGDYFRPGDLLPSRPVYDNNPDNVSRWGLPIEHTTKSRKARRS